MENIDIKRKEGAREAQIAIEKLDIIMEKYIGLIKKLKKK